MPHKNRAEITVTPTPCDPEKKTNFGAVIKGANLNELDDESFQLLREAVYTHGLVIIKDQHDVDPAKQFEFVRRFDPKAIPTHGFAGSKTDMKKEVGEALGKLPYYAVPGSGGVKVIGNGYQGDDHYGIKGLTLEARSHIDFHAEPLSEEEFEKGNTRFNTFHFDGIIYGSHPSRITTFRVLKCPKGPDLTVRWDDNEDQRSMRCQPGSTAFISSAQIYNLLTEKEKMMADLSSWEPAPHPFAWSGSRRLRSSGLGLAPGGKTVPLDELSDWTPDKVHKYPMVWLNPVTGEKCFQIMADLVHKLYLRETPDQNERIMEDQTDIRIFLNDILDRVAKPEYIMTPRTEEGDMVVWNNWGMLHSAIGYPLKYGPRTAHQCHIASSTAPLGPDLSAS